MAEDEGNEETNEVSDDEIRAAARALQTIDPTKVMADLDPLLGFDPTKAMAALDSLQTFDPAIAMAMIETNQALVDAMSQSPTIANAITDLNQRAISSSIDQDYSEFDRKANLELSKRRIATESIYEKTVHPYKPLQDKIWNIQLLLSSVILAAAADSGELSSDISEEQKLMIRVSIALLIGFAFGIPAGIYFETGLGIGTTIGMGGLSYTPLSEFYGIKQRQHDFEDDSETENR